MFVFINPGSGPVDGSTLVRAAGNMTELVRDAMGIEGENVAIERKPEADGDGRFGFTLRLGKYSCEVLMPGLELEQVRYLDEEGQNIWHFPRLYVDGSSWVWLYAKGTVRSILRGEDEDAS